MTAAHEKMLERVRALLAKAESTTFAEEAEAFTAKAQELMARYAIDEALLGDRQRDDAVTVKTIHLEGWHYMREWTLLGVIAQANGCQSIGRRSHYKVDPRTGEKRYYSQYVSVDVQVYGYADDLELVDLLFTSLLVQAATASNKLPTPPGMKRHTFVGNFLDGFAIGVQRRLQEANVQAARDAGVETDGVGTALVLVDKAKAVARYVAEQHPRTRKAGSRGSSDSRGYGDGRVAGEKANLGTKAQSVNGGAAQALGRGGR